MRIQHNIMAMNAYRNYTNNTSAVAKNLEKLSSGYRINRAGDDAAGLAISEKMRAQITGLSAAQKNVKDGISLVKTAEGATQEIHDMLNRMVYLAEQSSNGTYQDEVDREAITNEFEQLKSEINRIADSSNFNGIKLLDGSLDSTLKMVGNDDLITTANILTDGQLAKSPKAGVYSVDFSNTSVTNTTNAAVANATFTIFGKALTLDSIAAGGSVSGKSLAEQVAAKWNGQTTATDKQLDGVNVTATVEGEKVVFTMDKAPATHTITGVNGGTGVFANVNQNNGHEVTVTVEQEPVGTDTSRLYASAKFDITAAMVKDGGMIKIGDTSYVFAVGKNSSYKDAANVIDLTDKEVGATDLATLAAQRLSEAAKDNKNFKVGSALSTATITVTEREGGVDYSKNNLAGKNGLGTNLGTPGTAPTGAKDATQDDWKGLIQSGMADTSSKGSALTLQIGDTSDSFNQLKVSVKDMHTDALGIANLNLGTQAGAQAAVAKIKDAINYVSDARGTLGATQNRLEHTQNNLSVMKENIQDAESSIRDTDIAEEMMAYTKNNILVQSAQAMLAQANQLPQGVLQLLG